MSLINQMLADLEARKGGRLNHVDSALDGLHAAPLRAVAERPRMMFGLLAVAALTAALWASRAPLLEALRTAPPAPALRAPSAPTPVPVATTPPAPSVAPAVSPTAPPVVVLEAPPVAQPLSPPEYDVALPPTTVDALPLEPRVAPVTQAPDIEPIYLDDEGNEVAMEAPRRAAASRIQTLPRVSETVEYPGSFRREQASAPAITPQARRLAEIDAMLANGERERALTALRAYVLAAPADEPARERLALELIAERRVTEAEAVLRTGLKIAPASARLAKPLGHLLLAQERADAALNVLRLATPPIAGNADFHALLAAAEQRSGAHGLAITRYRGLLKEQPLNGSWLVGLGISLLAVDERADAQATFARALDDRALPEPLRAYATRELVRLKDGAR